MNYTKYTHGDETPMGKVFTAERRSGFNKSAEENKEHCIDSVIRAMMPWPEGTTADEKRTVAKQFIRDYYPHGVHRSRLPLMATIEVARYMVEFAKTHPINAAAPAEEPAAAAPAAPVVAAPAVELAAAPVVAAPVVELAASAPIFIPSPAPVPVISAETLAAAAQTFNMISPAHISHMAALACAQAAASAPAFTMPPAHYGGYPAFPVRPAHYGTHPAFMPAGYYGGRF